jgi:hypothetical protein
MSSNAGAYYEIFGYNRATYNYDIWLGTGTAAGAKAASARLGGFVGYSKLTPDGWACKANR